MILNVVCLIPAGQVATYGQVARLAGAAQTCAFGWLCSQAFIGRTYFAGASGDLCVRGN